MGEDAGAVGLRRAAGVRGPARGGRLPDDGGSARRAAARVAFGAVSMWARVFVDGQFLCEHACGYAPFAVALPPDAARVRHTLDVLVDNRFDFARAPMHGRPFDFYQYGGILREVTLRVLPPGGAPFIEAVHVTPAAEDYRAGGIAVAVTLGGRVPRRWR